MALLIVEFTLGRPLVFSYPGKEISATEPVVISLPARALNDKRDFLARDHHAHPVRLNSEELCHFLASQQIFALHGAFRIPKSGDRLSPES